MDFVRSNFLQNPCTWLALHKLGLLIMLSKILFRVSMGVSTLNLWRCQNIEPDAQNLLLINVRFPTISSHFFANYMNICHKPEVQTVILRCWTGLNLNWFKSYDTKCKYIFLDFANSRNDKWPFSTISSQCSAEVQTVILRCWSQLNRSKC